ncbi:hypothetical protein ACFWGM_12775 [Streptomyces roseolus]|uniref:hypothetical protein n=1 Tax=Streptomyces roseolus TaxID=67358 RepID=UPI00362ED5B7
MWLEDKRPEGHWQWGAPHGPGRTGSVKTGVRGVRGTSTEAAGAREGGFLISSENPLFLPQGVTMADLAFVATTLAVFALVALIAKGVAKP